MNRKKFEIIVSVIVLLILLLILWLVFAPKGQQGTGDLSDIDQNLIDTLEDTGVLSGPVKAIPEPIARSFVERLGSYSTESGYNNVTDIIPIATEKMQNELRLIAVEAQSAQEKSYYGVSTRVITIEVVEEGEDSVTLAMTTQREESIDSPANRLVRYQDIQLELIKTDEAWYVDSFEWDN
ncbi:MAG: hypothetical protein Q8P30_00030 [Candidatus Uhrbacteria bacterium]|nr:hypothetical protein [Candidatus Uhrbacteria bacterium]